MTSQGHARALVSTGLDAWSRVGAGAFLAFFTFTGFENLANMAEEAKNVGGTIPQAMLISLGISTVIYTGVRWRATNTGHGARRTTFSATLPRST